MIQLLEHTQVSDWDREPRMKTRDIIVIGGSAGSLPVLKGTFHQLAASLTASIFVVIHLRPQSPSFLPQVLQKCTDLRVAHAIDGEKIETGCVYVAPPDRHLLIEQGHIHLSAGPKENRTRPAANPLFRSAAAAYGPRVIGVVLSGALDDGTAGLWDIKRRGGIAIVQAPEDAEHKEMPESAIANVHVDYMVPADQIGPLLISLTSQNSEQPAGRVEDVMSTRTGLTCPDCYGPIERFERAGLTEYKCRVGHTYGPESMLEAHEDREERALWSAIESLEEGADLADELSTKGLPEAYGVKRNAEAKRKLAGTIRAAIEAAKLDAT
jgi:two-component system, chemotaxis family, protein-glutamate methylesterase/glutaminase